MNFENLFMYDFINRVGLLVGRRIDGLPDCFFSPKTTFGLTAGFFLPKTTRGLMSAVFSPKAILGCLLSSPMPH